MKKSFNIIQNQLKFQHTLNRTLQCYQSEVTFIFHLLKIVRALEDICSSCRRTYHYKHTVYFVYIHFPYKITILYGSFITRMKENQDFSILHFCVLKGNIYRQ